MNLKKCGTGFCLAMLLLTSCGSSKKIKEIEQVKENITEQTTTQQETNQTTTTTIDTTATITGTITEGIIRFEDFISGRTLVTENVQQKSETYYDKASQTIKSKTTVKDFKVHVKAKKETVTNTKINTDKNVNTKKEINNKIVNKEKTANPWYFTLPFMLLWLLIIVVLAFILKNIKKINSFLFLPLFLLVLFSCEKEDTNCNCPAAIYKNVYTHEKETYHNEPLNCETKEPIEKVKRNNFYFIECKYKPSY